MAKKYDNRGFKPLPLAWDEYDLISHKCDLGWLYFVQYNKRYAFGNEAIKRRASARHWLVDNHIQYNWVGGRSTYEFVFHSEQEAIMFKLAFG